MCNKAREVFRYPASPGTSTTGNGLWLRLMKNSIRSRWIRCHDDNKEPSHRLTREPILIINRGRRRGEEQFESLKTKVRKRKKENKRKERGRRGFAPRVQKQKTGNYLRRCSLHGQYRWFGWWRLRWRRRLFESRSWRPLRRCTSLPGRVHSGSSRVSARFGPRPWG